MMLDNLTLQIASLTTELALPAADITDEALDRYAPFMLIGNDKPADFKFNISLSDDRGGHFENETVTVAHRGNSLLFSRDDFTAEFDQTTRLGSATIHPSVYTLDTFLRIFYSTQLPPRRGLLLHASGVIKDGSAYIFIGPSESGKSTAASFSPPGGLLSDELTAVLLNNGSPSAHGTPFMGELNTGSLNLTAPVAGFYFLSRTGQPRLQKISAATAITKTLSCALNFDNSPATAAALLDNAIALCSSGAKLRELCYNKNENLWGIIANDNI